MIGGKFKIQIFVNCTSNMSQRGYFKTPPRSARKIRIKHVDLTADEDDKENNPDSINTPNLTKSAPLRKKGI
jgi:hypothetical protein